MRARKFNSDAWLEVEDRGAGIPTKDIDKIFDKFYRTDEAQAVPDAGLGLYLVRTIVRQQSGEIDVVSEPGKGPCFRVRLPLTLPPKNLFLLARV